MSWYEHEKARLEAIKAAWDAHRQAPVTLDSAEVQDEVDWLIEKAERFLEENH